MAVTITELRTPIDEGDSTSGWTLSGLSSQTTFSSDPTPIEPSYCLGIQANDENGYVYRTVSYNLTSTLIYAWIRPFGAMNDYANTGVGIVLGDGTNVIAYPVGGSDVSGFKHGVGPHEWTCFVLDTASLPSGSARTISGSEGSLNLGSITRFGIYFYTLAKALGGVANCFIDYTRYGTQGIRITGGGSGTEGTFEDIATAERTSTEDGAWGICRELAVTVFGVQGPITFGDSSSASTDFESVGETVVFESPYNGVATSRFWIKVQGNATGTTSVIFDGCTFICPAGVGASLDATDSDVDTFTMDGCTIKGFEQGIDFITATTTNTHTVQDCTFDGCGQIVPGYLFTDGTFDTITISNSTASATGALLLGSTGYTSGMDIENVTINSGGSGHGIYITQAGTYDFINVRGIGFGSDGTSDAFIYNNSGGSVTINATSCSGLTVLNGASASTTINSSVTVTVEAVTQAGVPIQGVRIYLTADGGSTVIFDGSDGTSLTDSNGEVSTSFNYTSDKAVTGNARKASSEPRYKPSNVVGTITSNGLTATVVMIPE